MINRSLLRILRPEIEEALKEVGEKYKLKFSVGRASFSDHNATFKLELATISKDGKVKSRTASDFELYAASWGLEPEDLGKTFQYAGDNYKIVGAKPRSYKYPILVERNGKTYKMPAEQVKVYKEMAKN